MKRTFMVYQHITKETAGEPTKYKVILKCDKDKLTLHSQDKSLFTEYTKGHEFQVTVAKEQQSLG